jgi:hypothetical protein
MQLGGRSGLRGQQDHLGGGAFTAQDLSGAGQAGFMLAGGSGAGSSTRGGGQGQGVTVLGAGPSQVGACAQVFKQALLSVACIHAYAPEGGLTLECS